jgi:PTH1 family peptidyl-tRNA hydrolase
MKLLVGLGNPGKQYELTRHNVGFLFVSWLISKWEVNAEDFQNKFSSHIWPTVRGEQKVLLVKPQTFMNESGKAVREIAEFYKLDPATELLVIHDEIDLPFGSLRSTDSSSAAGHNGVKDIIDCLGNQDFHRIRLGVETRPHRQHTPTDAFVLQNFTETEISHLHQEVFPETAKLVEKFIAK